MPGLVATIDACLHELCRYPDRIPGRAGNRAATALFASVAASCGLEVEVAEMDCLDFARGAAELVAAGETFRGQPGPCSNGWSGTARLTSASTIADLETGDVAGSVLLLHGELCAAPLTPKAFTYYEIPEHRRIVSLLEARRPAAVVAATGRNPDLAGALDPFPLIYDGDVDVPNAYLTDDLAPRLLRHAGSEVRLTIESRRIPATAQHVVARARGTGPGRVVAFGHIDSWDGAPGAIDNATGAAALLGLAHLLQGYRGRMTVELVPLNGEDYYAATGEKQFERDNEGRWDDVVLGLNVDAAGWRGHGTSVSTYGCDAAVEHLVRAATARRARFVIGEPWYQSDHGLFLIHGRPAVAVVSEDYRELASTITHTAADRLEIADPEIVAEVSRFLADVVQGLA